MISVVVPAYNEEEGIAACLEALLAQEGTGQPLEVIVVDDGSSDGTAAVVRRYPVTVLSQPHQGAAAARNHGAAVARGSILLFTDADCRPLPDWAARMAEPFADRRVSGVKGLFKSDQTALVARLVQAEYEEKEALMLARRRVVFADTASAGFRTEVFRTAGGFRTDMQAVEDTEFSFRLADMGYRLVVAPRAFVYHHHPESVGHYARRKFRYGLWGAWAYGAYPRRVTDDSRTPWSMRWQMLLAPLGVLTLAALPLGPQWRTVLLLLLAAFLATVLPFSWRNRHDPAVAIAAPLLFFIRALAVTSGISLGLARFTLARLAHRHPRLIADS